MNWHQVCLSECTPQPWRNGGGLTHEMAAWPDAINWIWRVSVARIERNGAFSSFDGVQRWFAVLTGQGVELIWPTYRKVLTPQTPPLQFAGTPACHAHLIAGPTLDFNLMTRGKHALLTSQSEKVDHGTWPANAFVGVFARDDADVVGFVHYLPFSKSECFLSAERTFEGSFSHKAIFSSWSVMPINSS